jgi:hypothetical protein
MKKLLKWALLGIGAIILISVFAKGGSKPTEQSQATPTEIPKEALKITAKELADDFDANQVAAEAKWENKLVEFSATISNITDSGVSFSNVASKEFSMTQVSCKIKDKQQLMSIKNGEKVMVRGVVGKQTIGVIDLNDCEIVK